MLELRMFNPISVRDGDAPKIVGYPSVFGRRSLDLGGFTEIVSPGAFDNTLQDIGDLMAKFNHSDNYVLGRLSAGTLSVSVDDSGLRMEIEPPATRWAQDLMVSIRRGDITGGSFAFRTVRDHWADVEGEQLRFLDEISLDGGDVSVVSVPAYPDTQMAVRSMTARRNMRKRYWAIRNLAYLATLDTIDC